jgi:hypothetical protein
MPSVVISFHAHIVRDISPQLGHKTLQLRFPSNIFAYQSAFHRAQSIDFADNHQGNGYLINSINMVSLSTARYGSVISSKST